MKNGFSRTSATITLVAGSLLAAAAAWAAGDLPTKFSNRGSIANTRHNMTQRQASGGGPNGSAMDAYRNDYAEVCVYCHTPHGSNTNAPLPLWNRTLKATTYTTYNQLNTSTLTQTVTQPGPSSIACLSCHDGQVAVDSVINMPGSGGYNAAQATSQNDGFLDAWRNSSGTQATVHAGLDAVNEGDGCLACHSTKAGKITGANATDFTVFSLGTDLRNDHPVGVQYGGGGITASSPSALTHNPDFRAPQSAVLNETRVWWVGTGARAGGTRQKTDLMLYTRTSTDGYTSQTDAEPFVECASCHDPHTDKALFLRISNAGSALCLACHTL
jgi:predicted CXXCH cytochrome family protein